MFVLGETFGTEDPRTGEIYTQVAEAQEADVDAAVKAARMVHTHPLAQFVSNHSTSLAQTHKQDRHFLLKPGVS